MIPIKKNSTTLNNSNHIILLTKIKSISCLKLNLTCEKIMGTARNHRFFGVMTYLLFEKESLKTLPMYTLSALLSALIFDFQFSSLTLSLFHSHSLLCRYLSMILPLFCVPILEGAFINYIQLKYFYFMIELNPFDFIM